MDATTERILEKTRERRLMLEKELKMTTVESVTPTSCISEVPEIVSAATPISDCPDGENGKNPKKRKSVDSHGGSPLADKNKENPSKKSSVGDASESVTPPPKPPRLYPFDKLEAMQNDNISQPTSIPTASLEESANKKAPGTSKGWFTALEEMHSHFEIEMKKPKPTSNRGRQHESPTRFGSNRPSVGTHSPVTNQNRSRNETTPSKVGVQRKAESGIESFYQYKTNQTLEAAANKGNETNPSISVNPMSKATTNSTTIGPRSTVTPGTKLETKQTQHLGGLSKLLTISTDSSPVRSTKLSQKATSPAGKVASLAGKWEHQFQATSNVSVKNVTPTATGRSRSPRPTGKVASRGIDQQRERVAQTPSSTGGIDSQKKPRIASGVVTTSRPPVGKLLNKWEKATQQGLLMNPDESFSESAEPVMAAAIRIFKPRHQALSHVPPATMASESKVDSKSHSEVVVEAPSDKPMEIPTSIADTQAHGQLASMENSPTVPVANGSPVVETASGISPINLTYDSVDSSALSDCLNDAIAAAQTALTASPKLANATERAIEQIQAPVQRTPVPMAHTLSVYRRMEKNIQSNMDRPLSIVVKPPTSPIRERKPKSATHSGLLTSNEYEAMAKELDKSIGIQQEHIFQASRAINLCKNSPEFRGSLQEVEFQKALLVATERRSCLRFERRHLDDCYQNRKAYAPISPVGELTITRIMVPLRREFFQYYASSQPMEMYHFVCMLKYRDAVHVTHMMDSEEVTRSNSLTFTGNIQFHHLPHDFEIDLEVYALKTYRGQTMNNEKNRWGGPKFATLKGQRTMPHSQSHMGSTNVATVVESTQFELGGLLKFNLNSVNQRKFTLHLVSGDLPFEGPIVIDHHFKLDCIGMETERGHLHRLEMCGGLAAWNCEWCVLNGNIMKFYKYPEEEIDKKAPLLVINLNESAASAVGPASSKVTSRPNAFSFRNHDRSLIVLAADTKDEYRSWCNVLNERLDKLRLWTVTSAHEQQPGKYK